MPFMASGISLANKCQLLFGAAIVVILACALSVPWFRTSSLVRDSQWEVARQLADAWLKDRIQLGTESSPDMRLALVRVEDVESNPDGHPFLGMALRRFREDLATSTGDQPTRLEHMSAQSMNNQTLYRYARGVRESELRSSRDPSVTDFRGGTFEPDIANPLRAILAIDRTSPFAEGQLVRNRIFIIAAGIVASLLAGLVFYLILTKLILSPVRTLRETTERVQGGDLRIRSQIRTGDEFELLADAFNTMLERLEQGQAHLRSLNESLDLKLTELSQANVGLYESNRFKSEFLANVSHELRTPLNSIIGFAELLEEIARTQNEPNPKQLRYLSNIVNSGRSLLEMINELLDMAKIEAGRMEVNIEPTNVGDLIEGLTNIMRPQAQSKQIELRTAIAQRLPAIDTDPGKLQQILYNFLSNAIKFTPNGGVVTISADRIMRQDNNQGVRLGVADTGPGIPYDMQDVIFEKFRQIDASHTREHAGTGLGLAICKELAEMLGATVSFVSEPGRGATFFVDLPQTYQPQTPKPLMAEA